MLTDTGRTRGTTLGDLTDEVQQVVGWIAEKYEETGLWPNQAWVWREIARRGLHHEIVVREGNQVFDHLGSPPSEKDFVRLRPWVLYDTGRCRQSFVRAYEVYRDIQGRLHTEESVTVTRKELGERYKLPFASKELHQLVWVLFCGFGGHRCDETSTETDWTSTFSLGFLKNPMPTLEDIFLGRPTRWIPESAVVIHDKPTEAEAAGQSKRDTTDPAPAVHSAGAILSGKASLRIFISHSSADVQVASALIDLLRSALNLHASDIRCTSVDGYRLEGGANTEESLRREVRDSELLVGIISRHSLGSLYVLFELGARWGAERPLIPLLAPGTPPRVLEGPLSNINALRLDSEAQVHQLVGEIAKKLNLEVESPAVYSAHLGALRRLHVPDVDSCQSEPAAEQPHLTAEAGGLLRGIGQMYVEAEHPNRAVWTFTPRSGQEPLFTELRAHGLVETLGNGNRNWRLTPDGLMRILAMSSRSTTLDPIVDNLATLEDPPACPAEATGNADLRRTLLTALQERARLDPAGMVSATFQDIATEIGSTAGVAHEILLGLRDEGHLELLYVEGSGPNGVFRARIPMRRY